MWDVTEQSNMASMQLLTTPDNLRRIAHRIADQALTRIGHGPEFDSRIVAVQRAPSRMVILDSDGANPFYLTRDAEASTPVFAGSGAILFAQRDAGATHLSLLNLVTNRRQPLLPNIEVRPNAGIAASRDGARIAFVVQASDEDTDISLVELRAPSQAALLRIPGSQIEPSFAGDGQRIAYLSGEAPSRKITISNLDGENVQILGPADAYEYLAWSPVADTFAFVRRTDSGAEIGVIAFNDARPRILATGANFERPSWSPSGAMLLVTNAEDGTIATLDVATGQQTPTPNPFGALANATWSGQLD
jgi:TolB protein